MSNNIAEIKPRALEVYRHYIPGTTSGRNSLCPFHKDKNPSFSLYGDSSDLRFKCFGCGKQGDVIDFLKEYEGLDTAGAIRRAEEILGLNGKPATKEIVAVYDYTDTEGNLLYQVVRYEPKDFRQRRPDGKGGWIWDIKGVEPVLYNLPEVVKSNYVFIVEGEKDVENLRRLGIKATCNPMGAGKWRDSYSEYFKDKRVYIIPDNDKPGRDHALQVARKLKGIASVVKVIELQGLPEKGDISDWIRLRQEEGKTGEAIKADLKSIIEATPEWSEPEPPSLLSSLLRWNDILSLDVKVEYLLDKLIPKGGITLLFGRGGIGKTSLTLQIGRAIAEGLPFGELETIKTPVYYIDFENPVGVLKERIECIGNALKDQIGWAGNAENFYVWHLSCSPQPPRLDTNDWVLYKQLPPGLLIFDTLRASHLADENDSQDMAVVISRLKELREAGFTILLLHHTPKGNEGIYKGSTALLDLLDHCLSIEELKGEDTIEFDKENTYRLGARLKTRYEPYHIYLKFNPDIKGFEFAKDPDIELMENMYEILTEEGRPLNQTEFSKTVREKMSIAKSKTEKLIKKGIGIFWVEDKEAGKRGLLYLPKRISQFPNTIYSQEIRKYNSQSDDPLGNKGGKNIAETFDNTVFPNFPEEGSGNQEIDLTDIDFEVIE